MKRKYEFWQRGLRGALAALLFLIPPSLWGESCPFCYSKAMASSAGILQAFRNGIIILMVPPFLMSLAITWLMYKRRNSFR